MEPSETQREKGERNYDVKRCFDVLNNRGRTLVFFRIVGVVSPYTFRLHYSPAAKPLPQIPTTKIDVPKQILYSLFKIKNSGDDASVFLWVGQNHDDKIQP